MEIIVMKQKNWAPIWRPYVSLVKPYDKDTNPFQGLIHVLVYKICLFTYTYHHPFFIFHRYFHTLQNKFIQFIIPCKCASCLK
uniref:Uncharacterized protein n=1 Tax=Pararge aegeria TaxID=116150 RepID=S4PZR5_9NEOP